MNTHNLKRLRIKGRRTTSFFVMFPYHVLDHAVFKTLSTRATKLVMDLAAQYRGHNNGDLCAPLSLMRERGWNSSDQLHKAKKELIEKDVIRVTRQGGLNKANLYALTWFPIDECKGKLDVSPTKTAPRQLEKTSCPVRQTAQKRHDCVSLRINGRLASGRFLSHSSV